MGVDGESGAGGLFGPARRAPGKEAVLLLGRDDGHEGTAAQALYLPLAGPPVPGRCRGGGRGVFPLGADVALDGVVEAVAGVAPFDPHEPELCGGFLGLVVHHSSSPYAYHEAHSVYSSTSRAIEGYCSASRPYRHSSLTAWTALSTRISASCSCLGSATHSAVQVWSS